MTRFLDFLFYLTLGSVFAILPGLKLVGVLDDSWSWFDVLAPALGTAGLCGFAAAVVAVVVFVKAWRMGLHGTRSGGQL